LDYGQNCWEYIIKETVTDEADFLEILFAISAMTNIRNLFSQAIQGILYWQNKKKTWRRINH
jgi:hypothetical protein